MKHIFRVYLLIFVALAIVQAADPIKFFQDGHDWEMMSDSFSKAMYVQGVMDGLSQAAVTITHHPLTPETMIEAVRTVGLDQVTPKRSTPPIQVVAALDSFYSDSRNAGIFIPLALRWAKVKLDGEATPEQLAAFASQLRTNHEEATPKTK